MADLPNEDLVYYCKSCHSLLVLADEGLATMGWDGSYCGRCQSTDIGQCSFEEWEAEEKRREAKRREIEWNR